MGRTNQTDWDRITSEQAYLLSQAEFKGMVVQALQDIREDIKEIKQDRNITRYISIMIAGVAGILTSALTVMGMKGVTPPTGP